MTIIEFRQHITRTLLYYEIFDHPLSMNELFLLMPKNSVSYTTFRDYVETLVNEHILNRHGEFLNLSHNEKPLADIRVARERLARRRIRIAKFFSRIIKRFPFVRGIFLSGDLSKGVATPPSDIDYVIIAKPGRLWICRVALILFKKIFLLNKKKYFCLNYFVTADHLELDNKDYYTATEIAHLKPLYNFPMFLRYMNANNWITSYFPNYSLYKFVSVVEGERQSILQQLVEAPLSGSWANHLDRWLMRRMEMYWKHKYKEFDDSTRDTIFRCTPHESRAFAGNFSVKIDAIYKSKLSSYNIQQ